MGLSYPNLMFGGLVIEKRSSSKEPNLPQLAQRAEAMHTSSVWKSKHVDK